MKAMTKKTKAKKKSDGAKQLDEIAAMLSATPKNKAKKPLGAKATLRDKFKKAGVVTSKQLDNIATSLSVSRSTVLTAMTDLKNPKYAGKAGPLNIEKNGDEYRLAK